MKRIMIFAFSFLLVGCTVWHVESRAMVKGVVVDKSTHNAMSTHYNLTVRHQNLIDEIHNVSYRVFKENNVGDELDVCLVKVRNNDGAKREFLELQCDSGDNYTMPD